MCYSIIAWYLCIQADLVIFTLKDKILVKLQSKHISSDTSQSSNSAKWTLGYLICRTLHLAITKLKSYTEIMIPKFTDKYLTISSKKNTKTEQVMGNTVNVYDRFMQFYTREICV